MARKMFRLSSLRGPLIDDILSLKISGDKKGRSRFTQVNVQEANAVDMQLVITNEDLSDQLIFSSDQVIYKKTASAANASVNYEDALDDFEVFWKAANKVLNFPEVRRIGLVGEFREKHSDNFSAGKLLIEKLTKFPANDGCGRFQLNFEKRSSVGNGSFADESVDDFYNTLYTFYLSSLDETPEKGAINMNIDIQRYYNPARIDALKELRSFKQRYQDEKSGFKDLMSSIGLINNESK